MASFNGVSKTSAKTSKQDYMNLLYTDSDSDQVPDLKLPPVKGKKQRRKRSPGLMPKHEGGCGFLCCFKAILVLLNCATLVVLAGLCIWTLERVTELQDQVKEMESSIQSEADVTSIQTHVGELDKSLEQLKSNGALTDLKSSIAGLDTRLKKVESSAEKLNQSVSSAQALLNMPQDLKSLTAVVTTMGSNSKQQSSKIEQLEQKIAELEAKLQDQSTESEEKKGQLDAQLGEMLSQQVAAVNESSLAAIVSVREQLDQIGGRLSTLEAFTQSREPGLGRDDVETLVMALIEEKMDNLTLFQSSAGSEANTETDRLTTQIARLSQSVSDLGFKVDNVNQSESAILTEMVSKYDFASFKDLTFSNFHDINQTIFSLDMELSAVQHKIEFLDSTLLNITSMFSDISLGSLDQLIKQMSNGGVPLSEGEEGEGEEAYQNGEQLTEEMEEEREQQNEQEGEEEENEEDQPPSNLSEAEAQSTTVSPVTSEPGGENQIPEETAENVEQETSELKIQGVETLDDLHEAFTSVWETHSGQLDIDYVSGTLLNNTMTSDDLEKFDKDGDGQLSELEMSKLLGITVKQ